MIQDTRSLLGPNDLTDEANFLWREGRHAFWYRLSNGVVMSVVWTPAARRADYPSGTGFLSLMQTWYESAAIAQRIQQDATEQPVFMSLDEVADIVKHAAEDSAEIWAWDRDDNHPFDEPKGWQSSEEFVQMANALASGTYEDTDE